MFLAVLTAVLGASEVSLSLERAPPCIDRSRLVTRLEHAGLSVVTTRTAPRATLTTDGRRLLLQAQNADTRFERAIPIEACDGDALERVVAALISAWSKPLARERTAERPKARPTEQVTAPAQEPISPAPAQADTLIVAVSPAPAQADTPEPIVIPVRPASPKIERAFEAPQPSPWEWEASLLGGVTMDPTVRATGAGQLELGLANGHFGALLEVGLQSARGVEVTGVRVEASTQWASLSARALFRPSAGVRLELALGFRAWRVSGQSTGFVGATSSALGAVGGVASTALSWRLVGPLALQARLFGSLRNEGARFFVDAGPSITLPPWEFGLLAGLTLIL